MLPLFFAIVGVFACFSLQQEMEILGLHSHLPLGAIQFIPITVFFYACGIIMAVASWFSKRKMQWIALSTLSLIFASFSLLLVWIFVLSFYVYPLS